jgi:hypothetical protein
MHGALHCVPACQNTARRSGYGPVWGLRVRAPRKRRPASGDAVPAATRTCALTQARSSCRGVVSVWVVSTCVTRAWTSTASAYGACGDVRHARGVANVCTDDGRIRMRGPRRIIRQVPRSKGEGRGQRNFWAKPHARAFKTGKYISGGCVWRFRCISLGAQKIGVSPHIYVSPRPKPDASHRPVLGCAPKVALLHSLGCGYSLHGN